MRVEPAFRGQLVLEMRYHLRAGVTTEKADVLHTEMF